MIIQHSKSEVMRTYTEVLIHEWEYKKPNVTKVTNAKLCDKDTLNKGVCITQQLLLLCRRKYKVLYLHYRVPVYTCTCACQRGLEEP